MTTWIKSGQSGLVHVTERKGGQYYVTLCGVLLSAPCTVKAQAGDVCPACAAKLEKR